MPSVKTEHRTIQPVPHLEARCRTSVERLTPTTLAISSRVSSPRSRNWRALESLAGVMVAGRPPTRPRARAAATPARERSMIISLSNWASAEKTWKTRRPPGVVVSIPSWRERKPIPRLLQLPHQVDQVPHRPAQPVQSPHDESVPAPQVIDSLRELWPLFQGARRRVGPPPLAARSLQRVQLQVELLLSGRDSGVADKVTHGVTVPKPL